MQDITAQTGSQVVLLHGLGRSRHSMHRMEKHLAGHGYRVMNIGYPSRRHPIANLAEVVARAIGGAGCDAQQPLHFVTHSLGGIIVRYLLDRQWVAHPGRMVMLAPPNQGSEVADRLKHMRLIRFFLGPVLEELGTDKDSIPNRLPGAAIETGVIIGNRSINPVFSALINGIDDGTVSLARARLTGMRDYLVVPCNHTFIMNNKHVQEQTLYFLRHGHFRQLHETAENAD